MGSLCPGRRQGPEASDGDQCPSRTSDVQTRPFMTLWEEERSRASSLRYGGRKARSLPRMRVGLRVKLSLRKGGLTCLAKGRPSGGCLTFQAEMGKGLVSYSVILVPVLINFEGLGASLNTREGSRADVYFPLFPFKDNFIKSLCFHSGLNMGHLNGKVIISPRLLMERRESGKGGMPVKGRGWQLRASMCAPAHACMHTQTHTDTIVLTFTPTAMYTPIPSDGHLLCTQRKTCFVHTLPNIDTSALASTHLHSPETLLPTAVPLGPELSSQAQTLPPHCAHSMGTLADTCRRPSNIVVVCMQAYTHTHTDTMFKSLRAY